jgi:hypothetical protein
MKISKRLANFGLFLVMMEGLTAFVLPSNNVQQLLSRVTGRHVQLRDQKVSKKRVLHGPLNLQQQQDTASVINSIKVWADAPNFIKEAKIVCSPTASDASGICACSDISFY